VSFGFFTDKYWGLGDDTPETGNEQYTRQDISATLYLQSPPKVFAADRSGLVIDYNYTEIIDKKVLPGKAEIIYFFRIKEVINISNFCTMLLLLMILSSLILN